MSLHLHHMNQDKLRHTNLRPDVNVKFQTKLLSILL
jgi:hypothetical protein